MDQGRVVMQCLMQFCNAFGQRVNASKYKVYFAPNIQDHKMNEICGILGMSATDYLGKYLGVPTINGRTTKATYKHVVERVEKRLPIWKMKCLSLAGCVILIQSTLAAIPTARLPRTVCHELHRKMRRFLGGGTAMERKPHLISWDIVTKSEEEGGLGIKQ